MRHLLKKYFRFSRSEKPSAFENTEKADNSLSFTAGQVIFEDEPYGWSVRTNRTHEVCAFCFLRKSVVRCVACDRVNYCSDECKTKDLPFHELECKVLQTYPIVPNEERRLVIRVLNRHIRELRESKQSVGDFFGCRRTISDLISHAELLTDSERLHVEKEATSIFSLVMNHIDTSMEQVFDLLLKCRINAHMVVDNRTPRNVTQGRAIYLAASKINHSCVNTGYVQMFYGRRYMLRAIRNVNIDDPFTITIHYVPSNLPLARRQKHLLAHYFFICSCDKCVSQLRRRDEQDVDAEVANRIMRVFRDPKFADLWPKIGVDLLNELQHLPDTNFYVNFVLNRLQLVCADRRLLEDSIHFGERALKGTEHILRRQDILFLLCRAMLALGWNQPQNTNYERFSGTVESTRRLYAVTHGAEHEVLRTMNRLFGEASSGA